MFELQLKKNGNKRIHLSFESKEKCADGLSEMLSSLVEWISDKKIKKIQSIDWFVIFDICIQISETINSNCDSRKKPVAI